MAPFCLKKNKKERKKKKIPCMTIQVQFTGKFISIILLIKFSQSLNLSCNHPIPMHHHYTYLNNLISSLPNDTSFDVDCIGSFPPRKLNSDVTCHSIRIPLPSSGEALLVSLLSPYSSSLHLCGGLCTGVATVQDVSFFQAGSYCHLDLSLPLRL